MVNGECMGGVYILDIYILETRVVIIDMSIACARFTQT